jgi:hypothetical protein
MVAMTAQWMGIVILAIFVARVWLELWPKDRLGKLGLTMLLLLVAAGLLR